MSPLCPHCGYNIEADHPVERDGWRIDPLGGVWFHDRPVRLRPAQAQFLLALARTARAVSRYALLGRISDRESVNLLNVHVSQVRRALRAEGVPVPFELVHGRGYRWCAGEMAVAA